MIDPSLIIQDPKFMTHTLPVAQDRAENILVSCILYCLSSTYPFQNKPIPTWTFCILSERKISAILTTSCALVKFSSSTARHTSMSLLHTPKSLAHEPYKKSLAPGQSLQTRLSKWARNWRCFFFSSWEGIRPCRQHNQTNLAQICVKQLHFI